ncbi:carboxymuconolactone decarboxylase family protein [Cohnella thailandensis]|uniref:Carboxymuconolactone decarboxylase family protein n=1 Tax=Cohnella thailandensis TaxID=557557 RepID=A0A841T511_9BACL|nr:carboxymuconolactone decarboxylase family protein [Cohnella thailandensis]MBB6637936.1 carboxymuconolactone decarboxylase family protein [Cohnella thailandensis]MBP1977726.1 AhpD family alkylhydroperoxidase [Cohnella thailandensis]
MKARINHMTANPGAYKALMALENFAQGRGIEQELYELIKIRASQINGCSFCLDMHVKDMMKISNNLERTTLVSVWREAPCYTDAEKAALALTEAVTKLSEDGVPQEVYDKAREYFDEAEFVDLIMAINAINCWNRIAVSTGMYPGCF